MSAFDNATLITFCHLCCYLLPFLLRKKDAFINWSFTFVHIISS